MGEQLPQTSINIAIEPPILVAKQGASTSILTRLPAGYFRICLSFGAQVLLWSSSLSKHQAHDLFHTTHYTLPSIAFLLLCWLCLCTLILLSLLYMIKCIFHFHLVKAEFSHHMGVNFLFVPLMSWLLLLLLQPMPLMNSSTDRMIFLWVFLIPILILDIKIYGQWFTTEKRFLSLVANPTSQLSVIGNLVSAWAAAHLGWKETAVSIFALGLTHYLVVFITLYQRLAGANRFPAMLRPDLFLFVAAPSVASLGWNSISGSFGIPCKMLFFLSLFLFTSLICRPTLFKKSLKRFNIAWWGYSFPLTFLALASAEYAQQVKGAVAHGLMLTLSVSSVLVFIVIMVSTPLNTDVLLLGNDPGT